MQKNDYNRRIDRFLMETVMRMRFIREMETEMTDIVLCCYNNLGRLLESSIITMSIYRVLLEHLEEYGETISSIINNIAIPLKKRIVGLLECRRSLINLLRIVPPISIIDLLERLGGIRTNDIDRLIAISEYFHPVSYEIFVHKTGYIGQRCVQASRLAQNRIKDDITLPNIFHITGLQYEKEMTMREFHLERIKSGLCNKNVALETGGFQLSIGFGNKMLVINGLNNKRLSASKSSEQIEIFNYFQDNIEFAASPIRHQFLDTLWPLDYYCNNILAYSLERFRHLSQLYSETVTLQIGDLIKSLLQTTFVRQRDIITALLCNTENKNGIYMAQLILDIIDNSSLTTISNPILTVFTSLPPKFQRLIVESPTYINKETNLISNIDIEDSVSTEQRIHMLNATNVIKAKALSKLKEIQSAKGEGTAKAQQYIDGLLKVPFGKYMEESIRSHQSAFRQLIISKADNLRNCRIELPDLHNLLWNELIVWSEKTITYLSKLSITCKDITTLDNQIRNDENICGAVGEFFERYSKDEWIGLFRDADIDISQLVLPRNKKSAISHVIQLPLTGLQAFNFINKCLNKECVNILSLHNEIKSAIQVYEKHQDEYFNHIDTVLDGAIYGMDDAKRDIKRLIAQWISGRNQGHVIGIEGPPGTGKTSIVKQGIAKCLQDMNGRDRPCVFIPIGGSANGAILEGHNYTYVGSTWGRILEGVMDAGCMNPIFYIDELDKISKTESGKEIIGILTHFTDPSQNSEFTDKYFAGIHFDMSKAIIIFSYNDASLLDRILLDRIQRIHIDPIKREEKIEIVHRHIMPEILDNLGIDKQTYRMTTEAIEYIIDFYTYEAGCRKLKERLYEFWREWNYSRLRGYKAVSLEGNMATLETVKRVLKAHDKIEITRIHGEPQVGIINGLYATSAGVGGLVPIEAVHNHTATNYELNLTGMQGDVMKESMSVARTLALRLVKTAEKKVEWGIHIHCPSGATPKDGPSAGTAITVALVSLLTGLKVRHDIGITGEIDLQGRVMTIGGLDSKIDGAKSAGCRRVLCPQGNIEDLIRLRQSKFPPETAEFQVEPISTIYQAIERLLIIPDGKAIGDYVNTI